MQVREEGKRIPFLPTSYAGGGIAEVFLEEGPMSPKVTQAAMKKQLCALKKWNPKSSRNISQALLIAAEMTEAEL